MIFACIVGGFAGLVAEHFYINDYWRPMTVTGLPVSIEDFLFGFLIAGIACSVYEVLFHYKVGSKAKAHTNPQLLRRLVLSVTCVFSTFLVLYLILGVNTMYATLVSFALLAVFILYRRPDLTAYALMTGSIMLVFTAFLYLLMFTVYPELIDRFWMVNNLTGFRFLKIPLEEYLWFAGLGLSFGPIYEFLADRRVKRF